MQENWYGAKRLAVTFTQQQAEWIEAKGRQLLDSGEAHGNGGEAAAVRMAVKMAMIRDVNDQMAGKEGA